MSPVKVRTYFNQCHFSTPFTQLFLGYLLSSLHYRIRPCHKPRYAREKHTHLLGRLILYQATALFSLTFNVKAARTLHIEISRSRHVIYPLCHSHALLIPPTCHSRKLSFSPFDSLGSFCAPSNYLHFNS